MKGAVRWATRLNRVWAKGLTLGLPAAQRLRRLDELDSDLWEEQQDYRASGRTELLIAQVTMSRFLRGIPSDLHWRIEMFFEGPLGDGARVKTRPSARAKIRERGAWGVGVVAALLGLVVLSASLLELQEQNRLASLSPNEAATLSANSSDVVINPLDSMNRAVAQTDSGAPERALRVTNDGGASWRSVSLPNPEGAGPCSGEACLQPARVAFGVDGSLFAAFTYSGGPSAEGVWLSKSLDGGTCFLSPVRVDAGSAQNLLMSIHDDGQIDLSWLRGTGDSGADRVFLISTDRGQTFSIAQAAPSASSVGSSENVRAAGFDSSVDARPASAVSRFTEAASKCAKAVWVWPGTNFNGGRSSNSGPGPSGLGLVFVLPTLLALWHLSRKLTPVFLRT